MRSLLFLFLTVSAFGTLAQRPDIPSAAIDNFLKGELSRQKIAGLSVGIVRDGKIVMAKGYGYANLEYDMPATENTVFKLGSVSKHIVATAIVQLAAEGKLSFADPIHKFYPDAPAHWKSITVRHLLNHTSGLERESPAFDPMVQKPDSVLIHASYRDSLDYPTGTKWQYSNLGYFILADIIRKLRSTSFRDYMEQTFFRKYGLDQSRVTSYKPLVKGRADGYVYQEGSISNAEDYIALRPSGAFLSSVTDMLRWELMLQDGRILPKENLQRMWEDVVKTPAVSANGEPVFYGYGYRVTRFKGRQIVFHTGVLPGFRAAFYRIPAERTAIVVLTNSEPENVLAIAEGVAGMVLERN